MNGLVSLALVIFAGAPRLKEPDPPALVGTWRCTGIVDAGRVNDADVE